MRENCTYGSEGGEGEGLSLPLYRMTLQRHLTRANQGAGAPKDDVPTLERGNDQITKRQPLLTVFRVKNRAFLPSIRHPHLALLPTCVMLRLSRKSGIPLAAV